MDVSNFVPALVLVIKVRFGSAAGNFCPLMLGEADTTSVGAAF